MSRESGHSPDESTGIRKRVVDWIDVRTGVKSAMRTLLDEHIPGGARVAYVFGSGLLFILLLQVITGVSLALYYTPTPETAHTSVAYITKQVAGGAFLRSMHSYGSSAMIIVLGLHFLQTFLYASFKGRRELLWLSGACLAFLILGMGFTGYLLPWDQKAYFATAVGTNVAGEVPFIGWFLTRFLRGGDTIGTLTLSRFYVAHVFLIPATIFLLVGAHVFLFRKAGPAGPIHEDPIEPKLPAETFYPRQVLMDMGFALVIMAALSALSYLRPVTLGPIANPSDSNFLPRPEWYYLPMFEWLKFWQGPAVVIGVVVIPAFLAAAFFLMPFIDRRLERRPWRRPIPALAVAIVVLGMVFLGVKSQIDDRQGPVAAQLAQQHEQEVAYSKAPFEPYTNASDGALMAASLDEKADPRVPEGKGLFRQHGCVGCHGQTGAGTAMAPSLTGITHKFGHEQLIAVLHNPTPRMKAAGMPSVTATDDEMGALTAYLGALGTPAANVAPVMQAQPEAPTRKAGSDARVAKIASAARVPQHRNGAHGVAIAHIAPVSAIAGITAPVPTAQPPREVLTRTPVDSGRALFRSQGCIACHGVKAQGTAVAPSLVAAAAKYPGDKLLELLRHPNSKMQAGGMPKIAISEAQLRDLVAYLSSLDASSASVPAVLHSSAVSTESPVKTTEPAQK